MHVFWKGQYNTLPPDMAKIKPYLASYSTLVSRCHMIEDAAKSLGCVSAFLHQQHFLSRACKQSIS
jgi:hypothetical protein